MFIVYLCFIQFIYSTVLLHNKVNINLLMYYSFPYHTVLITLSNKKELIALS